MTLTGLLTCVAQNIRVNIDFNGEYKVMRAHSTYKYEPERLPSSTITFKLNDLNADEKRNLIFQLHVPKVKGRSSSQNQYREQQQSVQHHVIGMLSTIFDSLL
jgi:hypothetical protein